MRFAIYARKSTESEDRQVQSLGDQIKELTNLAQREGYTVVEVYQESRSAKAPGNRPEFDRLITEIEAGHIDGVLAWAINRLSRNPVDGGRISYLLQTGRLSMIRTYDKTYLPDDNALLLSIENGMATAYIQDLSRSVRRGMKGKFERGWLPAKAPLGYKNDAESREVVPDPDRFDLVRRAWDLVLSGDYNAYEAARQMQSAGLTSFSKRSKRTTIATATMYKVFRNPFYCGRIRMNGQEVAGKHIPMVTEEEFARVQEMLPLRNQATKRRKRTFPFQGCFRCAECGGSVGGERKFKTYNKTRRSVEYVYYHCTGSKGCSKVGIRQEELSNFVDQTVHSIRITPPYANWLKKVGAAVTEQKIVHQDSPDSELEIKKAKERLDRLILMRADGEIGLDDFNRNRDETLDSIRQLEEHRRIAEMAPTTTLDRFGTLIDLAVAANQIRFDARTGGEWLRNMGGGTFHSGKLEFEPHPALQKIALLEPQFYGSQSPEEGDSTTQFKFWWSQVEQILNLINCEIVQ